VDPRPAERAAARRHLEALATAPRPAGGSEEARARAYCADVLSAAGLAVTEEPFSYSELPGRAATPVLGVMSGLLLAAAGHLGWRNEPVIALGVLLGGGALLGVVAQWVTRSGVLTLPWLRQQSTNLVASRGNPRIGRGRDRGAACEWSRCAVDVAVGHRSWGAFVTARYGERRAITVAGGAG
jgi:hypothetical protein